MVFSMKVVVLAGKDSCSYSDSVYELESESVDVTKCKKNGIIPLWICSHVYKRDDEGRLMRVDDSVKMG
jgi:hypothetical protein